MTSAHPQDPRCARLSELLAYPHRDPLPALREAIALAGGGPAHAGLARFEAGAAAAGLGALQELYTRTFDLQPACAPYLGAHLLPEDSPHRGRLLGALLEAYAAEGFRPREELADHVAEVLAFLAVARPGPIRESLLADGLVPALDHMLAALEGAANPYRDLLAAARALLAPAPARACDATA